MSVLQALKSKTLEMRKSRDPLAGSLQNVQSLATSMAKERAMLAHSKTTASLKEEDRPRFDVAAVQVSEDDAFRAVQKSIKQVQDTLSHKPDHGASIKELAILEALLPQMASEDEIRGEAESFVRTATLPQGGKAMGQVMAHLAATFGSKLDKTKASVIAKQVLAL